MVGVGAVVLRNVDLRDGGARLEVLLARRANPPSQGEWSLPGGVVELGETLQEAVVRELEEETGLIVDPIEMVEVLDHIVPGANDSGPVRFHYVLIDFVCRVTGGTLACASDAADVRWAGVETLSESGEFALASRTLAIIRKALQTWVTEK